MIAEDNDSNYSLVKHILKEYQITRVVNGVEAVEKVRDEEFDIVLMDMKMPIMGRFGSDTENQGAESYHPHYRTYRQCLRR